MTDDIHVNANSDSWIILLNDKNILDVTNWGSKEQQILECQNILRQARYNFHKVFWHSDSNICIAELFNSEGLFSEFECADLRTTRLSKPEWTRNFLELIHNSVKIAECLTLLCNLNELINYRCRIHGIINNIPNVKVDNSNPNHTEATEINTLQSLSSPVSVSSEQIENQPYDHTTTDNEHDPFFSNNKRDSHLDITNSTNFSRNHTSENLLNKQVEKPQQTSWSNLNSKMKAYILIFATIVLVALVGVVGGVVGIFGTTGAGSQPSSDSHPDLIKQSSVIQHAPEQESNSNQSLSPLRLQDTSIGQESSPVSEKQSKTEFTGERTRETRGTVTEEPLSESSTTLLPVRSSTEVSNSPFRSTSISGYMTSIQVIYAEHPSQIKDSIWKICNPNYITNLIVNVVDPYEWNKGASIDCPSRINHLTIQGNPSAKTIHEIVNQTNSIVHLKLTGSGLCHNDGLWEGIQNMNEIRLRKLQILTITGFTDSTSHCREALALVAGKLKFSKLTGLVIDGMLVTEKNKVHLQRIIYKAKDFVQEIKLNGIDLQNTAIFDGSFPALKLKLFHFYVKNSASNDALTSVMNFLSKITFAREYHSNVEIPDANSTMVVVLKHLKRILVRDLDIFVRLRESRSTLSVKFLSNLRSLIRCELRLGREKEEPVYVIDFAYLPRKLYHFQISSNHRFIGLGAYNLPCRGYFVANNSSGMYATLDKCPNCEKAGCVRR